MLIGIGIYLQVLLTSSINTAHISLIWFQPIRFMFFASYFMCLGWVQSLKFFIVYKDS